MSDLLETDAIYHKSSNAYFWTKRSHSSLFNNHKGNQRMRKKSDVLNKVTLFLHENDDEQININDLINKMKDDTSGDTYDHPEMKEELQRTLVIN